MCTAAAEMCTAAAAVSATPAARMTTATAAAVTATATAFSRMGCCRQRSRKNNDSNPEFEFQHDFPLSV
jgi:hypothetical protein